MFQREGVFVESAIVTIFAIISIVILDIYAISVIKKIFDNSRK
jgi:hypothetical protein